MLFKKKNQIVVQGATVSVRKVNGADYISLTDMIKSKEGEFFVKDWLRNRNTLEFLGVWEELNNPNFNQVEFAAFKEKSGLNSFKISVTEWVEKTNAIGIVSQKGRFGGTYAHVDIAFEFGTWINPVFKLYLIKEYQRLKEIENNQYGLEWDTKRILSKANYQIHTDAIKTHIIPVSRKWRKELEYADEADLLNLAIFGCTAKEWRSANPERHKAGENVRDSASINELMMISNAESLNAVMIKDGASKEDRFKKLQEMVGDQLSVFNKLDAAKSLKKSSDDVYVNASQHLEKLPKSK